MRWPDHNAQTNDKRPKGGIFLALEDILTHINLQLARGCLNFH